MLLSKTRLILLTTLLTVGLQAPAAPAEPVATLELSVTRVEPLNVDNVDWTRLMVGIDAPEASAYDVVLTLTGSAGVELSRTVKRRDALYHYEDYSFLVRATPGSHTLTLTLSAANAPTVTRTLDVWGRGGPPPTQLGSLAGRGYVSEDDAHRGSRALRTWRTMTFLNDQWVYTHESNDRALDVDGSRTPSRCRATVEGCERYAYDPVTRHLHVDGWLGSVGKGSMTFDGVRYQRRIVPARGGTRLAFTGSNVFAYDGFRSRLVLRKGGTFLRRTTMSGRTRTVRGSYRIRPAGLLVLRPRRGEAVRSTLNLVAFRSGRPVPRRLGVHTLGVWYHPSR